MISPRRRWWILPLLLSTGAGSVWWKYETGTVPPAALAEARDDIAIPIYGFGHRAEQLLAWLIFLCAKVAAGYLVSRIMKIVNRMLARLEHSVANSELGSQGSSVGDVQSNPP